MHELSLTNIPILLIFVKHIAKKFWLTNDGPASTSFDVELSEEIEDIEPVEIELRNDYGALVKSETVQGGKFKINVSNLKNVPYILKVKYRDQILTHRVMIEN